MAKKITTESFIARAKQVHGDKYDYCNTIYTAGRNKIKIKCSEHGEFSQIAESHLAGKGCKLCANKSISKTNTKIFGEVIKDFKKIHGTKYNYSLVKYTRAIDKVDIICKKHGIFKQSPNSHLGGQGCPTCGTERAKTKQRKTIDMFIKKAVEVHNNFYSYEKSKYIGSRENITITCPIHGDFEQLVTHHLKGHGCQKCADENGVGFRKSQFAEKYKNQKCTFYIIGIKQGEKEFIKIGITGKTVQHRFKRDKTFSYKTLLEIYGDSDFIWDLELNIKRKLYKYQYIPEVEFGGYTECFTIESLKKLHL